MKYLIFFSLFTENLRKKWPSDETIRPISLRGLNVNNWIKVPFPSTSLEDGLIDSIHLLNLDP